jgi:hypothetical protein
VALSRLGCRSKHNYISPVRVAALVLTARSLADHCEALGADSIHVMDVNAVRTTDSDWRDRVAGVSGYSGENRCRGQAAPSLGGQQLGTSWI